MNIRLSHYLLLLIPFVGMGQMETAKWQFGYFAALDFQSGVPVTLGSSSLYALYSSCGIADSLGNELFYVESGYKIYNKNNVIMANGANIGALGIGPQLCIVVRKSGSQYYVITNNSTNSLNSSPIVNYSIVDMSLAAGLGSVTVSNLSITPAGIPMVGKLAVTKHCNQTDHWLLTHRGGFPGSNQFYAYQVTNAGIAANPVISSIGSNQPGAYHPAVSHYQGFHKFSSNGKKVCATLPYGTVELYDFDNGTGILSNVVKLDSIAIPTATYDPQNGYSNGDPNAIGIEFSPDGTKLYITYTNGQPFLCQFDLCAGSTQAIKASKTIISNEVVTWNTVYRTLQTALDGKIYVAAITPSMVGVINNPNALGLLCNYSASAVPLGTIAVIPYNATMYAGLPNFISSFFEQKPVMPPLTSTTTCGSAGFSAPVLCAATGYSVLAYQWNFNDVLSGASNISNLANPTHFFSANGTYLVKLVLQYPCGADTLKKIVTVDSLPNLSITAKTVICTGQATTFTLNGATSYSLNGLALGQNSVVVQPTTTTVYTLTGSNALNGCQSLKVMTLSVRPCTGMEKTTTMNLRELTKVYPNPTEGLLTVELLNSAAIVVKDLTGRVIYNQKSLAGTNHLDLSEQAAGIYFLSIEDVEGSMNFKVIRE